MCTGPCRPRVACSAEPRKALPACTAKTCCVACRPPVWLACRCVIGPSRGLKRSRESLLGTGLRARPSRQGEKDKRSQRRATKVCKPRSLLLHALRTFRYRSARWGAAALGRALQRAPPPSATGVREAPPKPPPACLVSNRWASSAPFSARMCLPYSASRGGTILEAFLPKPAPCHPGSLPEAGSSPHIHNPAWGSAAGSSLDPGTQRLDALGSSSSSSSRHLV